MPISLSDAKAQLLKGAPLTWKRFENHKAGSIVLGTARARRLFKFLAEQVPSKVAEANEQLFPGLIEAWTAANDPAEELVESSKIPTGGVWKLARLEAKNFGGLTTLDGPTFDLAIGGENWCLEGQNGCGKTSLSNAILWAMTGKRVREQSGLIDELGARSSVKNIAGKEIGTWPSLVSYPKTPADLDKDAVAWVRLTFENEKGEQAFAERKISSPKEGDPLLNVSIDGRLTAVPQLLETGLLMPARIPRIGFGERSQSLYEAVKLLTGLDQLADIAEGASKLGNKAQRFYKYAKDQGIEAIEATFGADIEKAEIHAANLGIDISTLKTLGRKDLEKSLTDSAKAAAAEASAHIATLKSEIADGLDTNLPAVRAKVKEAVANARAVVGLGVTGIAQFEAWIALKNARADEKFNALPASIDAAERQLDEALRWHQRQVEDGRLRLKALAAQYFVVPENDELAICPLCESQLSTKEQKNLAAELQELRKHSSAAEGKVADICGAIDRDLRALLTADVRKHFDLLRDMVPADAYADAARSRFSSNELFSSVLTGLKALTDEIVNSQLISLPVFSLPLTNASPAGVPQAAAELHQTIHSLRIVYALAVWWGENATAFREAWANLVGRKDEHGKVPERSISGQLQQLEQAIEKAEPLDKISNCLTGAAVAAAKWETIKEHQRVREEIIEALEPLKELRHLVGAETARSIVTLSNRIKEILKKIHLQERFSYEDASLDRKAVNVEGSFDPGLKIDASLVANTSWLRAILWAFVFALREETIEQVGSNPMPLVVLDDPQVTFDPRNKRKWAQEIARLANASTSEIGAMHLIITTHERQFFQFLVDENLLEGQQGLVAPVNNASPVVTIVNGTNVDRLYERAFGSNDDAIARQFISAVRVYTEDLLKCMMRAESPDIVDMSLDALRNELKRLREAHVQPFNRQVFKELVDMLIGGGGKEMNIINDLHHKDDESFGVAQAKDIKSFWDKKLRPKLHQAFHVCAQFEAFSGEPRLFAWQDSVVAFPDGHKDTIKKLTLLNTGVAAAAKTDGRAGDGIVTLKEWDSADPILLFNHDVYQLAAGTLDPVAGVGDFLIVSNFAPVTKHSLVVAALGEQLLARRHSETDVHPDIAVLTGQTLDPHNLPQPIIATKEKVKLKKIVGTLFVSHLLPPPAKVASQEVIAVTDLHLVEKALTDARLFQVEGRSAEPVALETQFLITHPIKFGSDALKRMEGRLVVAVDDEGTRYFKRLRVHKDLVVLESLNPDGLTPAQLLSLDESDAFPRLVDLLEVVGVLFEIPAQSSKH